MASGFAALLPLSAPLARGLRALGARRPLPIQAAAIPRVYAGESVAVHAETGSGKTLSYLLPLLARSRRHVPRQVLVLVPSRQLGLQTVEFADRLTAHGGPAAAQLRAASEGERGASLVRQRDEMLIVTRGELAALWPEMRADGGSLLAELRRSLHALVIDEPDAVLAPPNRGNMYRRHRRYRCATCRAAVGSLARTRSRHIHAGADARAVSQVARVGSGIIRDPRSPRTHAGRAARARTARDHLGDHERAIVEGRARCDVEAAGQGVARRGGEQISARSRRELRRPRPDAHAAR